MNKILKRVMTMFGAGVMALSLLAPVTEATAASKNKVVEVPVHLTNSAWVRLIKQRLRLVNGKTKTIRMTIKVK